MGLTSDVIIALALTTGPIFVYWFAVSTVSMYKALGATSVGHFFVLLTLRCRGKDTREAQKASGSAGMRKRWEAAAVKNEVVLGAKRSWIVANPPGADGRSLDPISLGLKATPFSLLRMRLLAWAPYVALLIEFLQLTSFSFGPSIPWFNPTLSLGYNLPVRLLNVPSLDFFSLYTASVSATYIVFLAICALNALLLLALPLMWRKARRLGSFESFTGAGVDETRSQVLENFDSQTAPSIREAYRSSGMSEEEVEAKVQETRDQMTSSMQSNYSPRKVFGMKLSAAWTLMVNSALVTFLLDVTFLPTMRAGLAMFACTYFYSGADAGRDPVLDRDPTRVCWKGSHFAWVAMAAVLLVLVYPFYLSIVLSSPFSKSKASSKVITLPRAAVTVVMLKAFIVGVTTLATTWIKTSLTLNFLTMLLFTFESIVSQPALGFTRKRFNALRSASLGGALWSAGAGLWTAIRDRPDDAKPFIVFVAGVLPAMAAGYVISRWFGRDTGLIVRGESTTAAMLAERDEHTREVVFQGFSQALSMGDYQDDRAGLVAIITQDGVLQAFLSAFAEVGRSEAAAYSTPHIFGALCAQTIVHTEVGRQAILRLAASDDEARSLPACFVVPHCVVDTSYIDTLRAGAKGTTKSAEYQRKMVSEAEAVIEWAAASASPVLLEAAKNHSSAKVRSVASESLKLLGSKNESLRVTVLDAAKVAVGIDVDDAPGSDGKDGESRGRDDGYGSFDPPSRDGGSRGRRGRARNTRGAKRGEKSQGSESSSYGGAYGRGRRRRRASSDDYSAEDVRIDVGQQRRGSYSYGSYASDDYDEDGKDDKGWFGGFFS